MITDFLKNNGWWISLLLIGVCLALMIYLAITVPADATSCMSNGVAYYMNKTGAFCTCNDFLNPFG